MDVRLRELYLLFRGYEVHGLVCVQMYFVTLLVMLTRWTCTALSSSHMLPRAGLTPVNTCSFMYIQSRPPGILSKMKTGASVGACIGAVNAQYCNLPNVWSYTQASTPVCVHEPLVVAYRVKSRGETQHTRWSTLHLIQISFGAFHNFVPLR